MRNRELDVLPEDVIDMIHRHTKLNANKIVSYLPLNTIEGVMGLSLEAYTSMIETNGANYLIFGQEECCISSGAVYAFLSEDLNETLEKNKDVLIMSGISCESTEFIRAIADTWFEDHADIMPLLKKLFGDI